MARWPSALHPLLFAAYPPLLIYSETPGELAAGGALRALLGLLAATSAALLLGRFAGFGRRGALAASLSLFLVFAYGPLLHRLGIERSGGTALAWLALVCAAAALLPRREASIRLATRMANAMGIVLVGWCLVALASRAGESAGTQELELPALGPAAADRIRGEPPDIFLIVLDAYGRADVLRSLYGFDNSEFLDFLRGHGFAVADAASANYGQTAPSLASMLNLAYLDPLSRRLGPEARDHRPLFRMIRESALQRFLASRGYSIVAFASGYLGTRLTTADRYVAAGPDPGSLATLLAGRTPLSDLLRAGSLSDPYAADRARALAILRGLRDAHDLAPSPKFVFAHVPIPHPPFVFGPGGERRTPGASLRDADGDWLIRRGGLTREEYRAQYRDQLIYVNRELVRTVDAIVGGARRPVCVVLVGDHGPRSGTDWSDPRKTDHREAMGVLLAVRLPDRGALPIDPDLSLVNVFRVVLDRTFGTRLGRLPDRNYYATAKHAYRFLDVTERVRGRAEGSASALPGAGAR